MMMTIQYLSMDSNISSKMEPELKLKNFLHKFQLVKSRKSCAASNFFLADCHVTRLESSVEKFKFFSLSIDGWTTEWILCRWMVELIVVQLMHWSKQEQEKKKNLKYFNLFLNAYKWWIFTDCINFFLHFIIEPYLHNFSCECRQTRRRKKESQEWKKIESKNKLRRVWEKITIHVIIIILWIKLSGNFTPWIEKLKTIAQLWNFSSVQECVTVTIVINVVLSLTIEILQSIMEKIREVFLLFT